MSYDIEQPAITKFRLQITSMLFLSSAISSTSLMVLCGGPDERIISGNTAAVQTDLPFNALSTFGGTFLSNFECSQMAHPLLEQISFVDTPGVQLGEKENTHRSYDFTGW
ncbi:hypothetical protein OSB04_un000920 [Centaurea solstitialis]|uniref:Uncharacterized protein n=1 Tax=Centaurea solstitialis TaxID=347529 RepID=A0AA38SH29_9ASTR|nr:hypothetical protein OSB04_un000920 [Centaurea solstitialis]